VTTSTDEAVPAPFFTQSQIDAALVTGALLRFVDGANDRTARKSNHDLIIAYVFEHLEHEMVVRSLIQRGVTDYDEIITGLGEAKSCGALQDGLL